MQLSGPPLRKYLLGTYSALGKRNRYARSPPAPPPRKMHPRKFRISENNLKLCRLCFGGKQVPHCITPTLSPPATSSYRVRRTFPSGALPGRPLLSFSKAGPEALSNLSTAERAATRKSSDWFPVPGSCRLRANHVASGTVSNQKNERKGCTQPSGSLSPLTFGTEPSVCEGGRPRVRGPGGGGRGAGCACLFAGLPQHKEGQGPPRQ